MLFIMKLMMLKLLNNNLKLDNKLASIIISSKVFLNSKKHLMAFNLFYSYLKFLDHPKNFNPLFKNGFVKIIKQLFLFIEYYLI